MIPVHGNLQGSQLSWWMPWHRCSLILIRFRTMIGDMVSSIPQIPTVRTKGACSVATGRSLDTIVPEGQSISIQASSNRMTRKRGQDHTDLETLKSWDSAKQAE